MIRRLLAPRLLALHLLAVLAVGAAAALGAWQYDAWRTGRAEAAVNLTHVAPKPLTDVLGADQPFPADGVGRPVTLRGRWLPAATLFVSDRVHRGRSGVWAVTPVAVCDPTRAAGCARAPAVLVVRGWTASVRSAPAAPSGAVRLTGWLQPGEGASDSDPDPGDDVLPTLRVADAVQRVKQDLFAGYVVARSAGQPGLAAVGPAATPKVNAFTSVRNLLYALEWWVFGGFAVYAWWRWCRDEVTRVTGVASRA